MSVSKQQMDFTATKTQPPGYSPPYQGYPQPHQGYQQPNATAIPNIQYQPQSSGATALVNIQGKPLPEDFLIPSIFITLFCCWPIGIFAILKAIKCRDAKKRGDVDEAVALSKSTRKLMHWTVGVGVATYIVMVILCIGLMVLTIFFANMVQRDFLRAVEEMNELGLVEQSTMQALDGDGIRFN